MKSFSFENYIEGMRYFYFSINEYKKYEYNFCYALAKRMDKIFDDEMENRLISAKIDYLLENVRKLAKEKNIYVKNIVDNTLLNENIIKFKKVLQL